MYIASKYLFGPAEVPGAAELNTAELKRIREAYSLRRADRYTALVVGAAVRAAQGVEVAGTGTALVTTIMRSPAERSFSRYSRTPGFTAAVAAMLASSTRS